jgi:hypothetical protein
MGCYGIGISRPSPRPLNRNHDLTGSSALLHRTVPCFVPINYKDKAIQEPDELYQEPQKRRIEVLLTTVMKGRE